MVNKSRILSDLSKFAVDAMSTFSSLRKEIETMVSLRVDKVINKMNLVKRDEFDSLKRIVQKSIIDNEKLKNPSFMFSAFFKTKFTKDFDIIHAQNPISAVAMKNISGKKILTIHGIYSEQIGMLHGNLSLHFSNRYEKNAPICE